MGRRSLKRMSKHIQRRRRQQTRRNKRNKARGGEGEFFIYIDNNRINLRDITPNQLNILQNVLKQPIISDDVLWKRFIEYTELLRDLPITAIKPRQNKDFEGYTYLAVGDVSEINTHYFFLVRPRSNGNYELNYVKREYQYQM